MQPEESLSRAKELMRKGIDPSLLTTTLEQPARVGESHTVLRIGVPKERVTTETRVGLTPGAVQMLVAQGHQVFVEHHAGLAAQYTDADYTAAGAFLVYAPGELYTRAEIVVKIAPLTQAELDLVQPKQTLISAVNVGQLQPDYLKALIHKNITAIGFEYLQAADGSVPIMRLMSEIAGISSIHIASGLLANPHGKGLLLGGVTGVPPAQVTIIGAGTVGYHAVHTAIALGAMVRVLDEEVYKLKRLEENLGRKIYTSVSQPDQVALAVREADVVIGAAYRAGRRAPVVVTEEMVAQMREGSVVVDVAIDQGGCIATSRPTQHDNPTFTEHGVLHYCVPNIAARVARTASASISNILGPLLARIGEAGGVKSFMAQNRNFKRGIYVYHRHITQRALASMYGMDFMDIDLLYAAHL